MSPVDQSMLAVLMSSAALLIIAGLTPLPVLIATRTPLAAVLRRIRLFSGRRALHVAVTGADGRCATGTLRPAADWTGMLDATVSARDVRGMVEGLSCGEALMQWMLAIVRDGRIRIRAAALAFAANLPEGRRLRRRAATLVRTGRLKDIVAAVFGPDDAWAADKTMLDTGPSAGMTVRCGNHAVTVERA